MNFVTTVQKNTIVVGEKIEVFEFTGAMVDSNKEETMTIDQLYERINSES